MPASPGAFAAAGTRPTEGRIYDRYAPDRAAPVAVIGEGVAERLGTTTLETRPAVFVGSSALRQSIVAGSVCPGQEVLHLRFPDISCGM
ncbi:ABC transporter permease [Streptomyces filamentosus]